MGVKHHHLVTVSACTTAKQAWDALEVSFSAQTNARRAQLTVELTTIKNKTGKDIHMYNSRAKAHQAELATAGQQMDANAVILYLLRGLGDEYKIIKTVLLAAPQFLAWESVTTALLPVEAELGKSVSMDEGGTSAAYQAGQVARNEARKQSRRSITCWSSNKKGHYQSECRSARADGDDTGGSSKPVVFMVTGQAKETVGMATVDAETAGSALAATAMDQSTAKDVVFIDSGATHHMMKQRRAFFSYQEVEDQEVSTANRDKVPVSAICSVVLHTSMGVELVLEDTLHVPGISANLLSVRAITKKGCKVDFDGDVLEVLKDGRVVATGCADRGGQYLMEFVPEVPAYASVAYGKLAEPGHL